MDKLRQKLRKWLETVKNAASRIARASSDKDTHCRHCRRCYRCRLGGPKSR